MNYSMGRRDVRAIPATQARGPCKKLGKERSGSCGGGLRRHAREFNLGYRSTVEEGAGKQRQTRTVKIGDLSTDRQTQTGSCGFRREEGIEDLRTHDRIDSHPIVEDAHDD